MTRFPFFKLRAFSLAAVWLLAGLAQAQPPSAAAGPLASPLTYRSAIADYQPYAAQPVQPWAETNATVGRIGGWRAYAREAAAPSASEKLAPQAGPAPAAPSAANPHAGQHTGQP